MYRIGQTGLGSPEIKQSENSRAPTELQARRDKLGSTQKVIGSVSCKSVEDFIIRAYKPQPDSPQKCAPTNCATSQAVPP
jgi:hypothetical protein